LLEFCLYINYYDIYRFITYKEILIINDNDINKRKY